MLQFPSAPSPSSLAILGAMITPAVLISACGTLIFSTSNRLARIVDRVRELSRSIEQSFSTEPVQFREERQAELERQIAIHAIRSRLIQQSLTSFYVALGVFVGTTISIGFDAWLHSIPWLPSGLGIAGTVVLFYGCVLLIAEARMALRSVKAEMEFTLRLSAHYGVLSGTTSEAREKSGNVISRMLGIIRSQ
jgi:hypothetical protein